MPGAVQAEGGALPKGSPPRKSRLSLKFFQKKETKRALDFSEAPENEPQGAGEAGPEIFDQVVPAAHPSSPACCDRKEKLPPFAGLNNLGNTCYLNSILQVLYYCPGFTTGVKYLNNIISMKKELLKDEKDQKEKASCKEDLPACYELICSLHCLILSVEQLQGSCLLNPDKYTEELSAPPRRLLNTLRELNPMYEGYLQHDAQEVLQCILGYIRESCQMLKKEELESMSEESICQLQEEPNHCGESSRMNGPEEGDGPATIDQNGHHLVVSEDKLKTENGKRKSDTEVGNTRKKPKVTKEQKLVQETRMTRSKRKPPGENPENQTASEFKSCIEMESARPSQKKSRLSLNWLKSSGQQSNILSKFCSLGKLTSKGQSKESTNLEMQDDSEKYEHSKSTKGKNGQQPPSLVETVTAVKETEKILTKAVSGFELVEKLFQGQLVLRTRCLECECFTERREDFQDISVPVQEDELSKAAEGSEVSPEPKTDIKTLKWAISQFASVERIVGEDKYFCETCHHYTEAERSLLFDKMPEIITIHLKCFAANGLEFDCYGGLSKVNTPLLTPLKLSLEEWSTKPTNDLYGLFAVVMHSGITIGSGHYTAYVKVTDSNLELDKNNFIVNQMHEMIKPEPLNEEEARAAAEDYGDTEVSFKVPGNGQPPGKVPSKKNLEAIGLLGGQKSKPDCELCTNKALNPDKVVDMLPGNKHFECPSLHGSLEPDSSTQGGNLIVASELEKRALDALQSLREYEGKWLLFDDSEVRIIEERDFLTSLSPSTSSSTPYLLFYKKITE
ncbi:ubiquitin carboxyl-terminal hydrolase 1 [Rhinatrema bivittatum]|uniref:ubiquitin carboxyl-terminal hydrolase 1 n=1 Tax=Rhinatrema bivittatum TaxID=194408 RepID=UPI001125C31A|nr:ubiquitin carboxyl-terminal hydrolase 1 [Rhinatrema bivittatum]